MFNTSIDIPTVTFYYYFCNVRLNLTLINIKYVMTKNTILTKLIPTPQH